MSETTPCPVCQKLHNAEETVCATCGWELLGDPIVGGITHENQADYDQQLSNARLKWQQAQQTSLAKPPNFLSDIVTAITRFSTRQSDLLKHPQSKSTSKDEQGFTANGPDYSQTLQILSQITDARSRNSALHELADTAIDHLAFNQAFNIIELISDGRIKNAGLQHLVTSAMGFVDYNWILSVALSISDSRTKNSTLEFLVHETMDSDNLELALQVALEISDSRLRNSCLQFIFTMACDEAYFDWAQQVALYIDDARLRNQCLQILASEMTNY